jgi:hypothetical protein
MPDLSQKTGHWSVLPGSGHPSYVMALGCARGYTKLLIVLDGELAVP